VHVIHHSGPYFTVRGPLNVPRPPQGIPVLIMSDPATTVGRRFVASTADVILTNRGSLPEAAERCRELHALAPHPRILANVHFVLGDTEAAALRRAAELDAFASRALDGMHFAGTPEQLVDLFATWHQHRACDGFNLLPAVMPDDVDLLVDAVIPLAQSRSLFRTSYTGTTLREHFGLARPRSQYATAEIAGS
jgi:alkanesulfonate monooxygenase SsuD/methylene tetrahydromethanopterin reductase-like flavin-dependent oxidoreductase (luciferase family)